MNQPTAELTSRRHGLMVACDFSDLKRLRALAESLATLDFVVGYKVGAILALRWGVERAVEEVRAATSAPVIYDHQKFGTDIPDICGGEVLAVLKSAGVAGVIAFPQAGPDTLRAFVAGCRREALIPIVGGEMTHQTYLASSGGYIATDAPARMYRDGADAGCSHFVVPGTKVGSMQTYRADLESRIIDPAFMFPGIGKGQGGDIVAAFEAVRPLRSYAIVGRGLYGEADPRAAAMRLWSGVEAAGLAD